MATSARAPQQPAPAIAMPAPQRPRPAPLASSAELETPRSQGQGSRAFACAALLSRLSAAPSTHGWAAFLPEALRQERRTPAAGDAGASSCCGSPASRRTTCSSLTASSPSSAERPAGRAEESEPSSPEGAAEAAAAVAGHVWRLSQDPVGCRAVQDLLHHSPVRRAVAAELVGHVVKAARSPHANHVMQKFIAASRPQECQFIIDELSSRAGLLFQTARHRYGCRIVQQLIRHCPPSQLESFSESLLLDAHALCCHSFGTFVMQHFVAHTSEAFRGRVVRLLGEQAPTIAQSSSGCGVIVEAMQRSSPEEASWLARCIALEHPALLETLAATKHGYGAAITVLEALEEPELSAAQARLLRPTANLGASRHGTMVLQFLEGR